MAAHHCCVLPPSHKECGWTHSKDIVYTLLRISMGDGSFQDALWGCRAQCSLHHKNKSTAKVQNIFVISPHSTSPDAIALFTILLYHLLLPSCAVVKLGGGRGDRWATFGKCRSYKYLLYCDNHFTFNHQSVQVI